jgi:sulfate adenylyltransferase large subunit
MSLIPSDRNTTRPAARRIAFAGSVDDGKSTLTGRLLYDAALLSSDQDAALKKSALRNGGEPDLASITDGLTDEREQGITIDVAWRYLDFGGQRIVLADVPGHEQYTRNMVTAASTADTIVVLVDAQSGATVQTWRHLFVAMLVGVKNIIVAINKMDLIDNDFDRYSEICAAVRSFAAPFADARLVFVPVSALRGDNVVHPSTQCGWYDGPTLYELMTRPLAGTGGEMPLRLPVRYVSRPGQNGTARSYMGRLSAGQIRQGDTIVSLPNGRTATVNGIWLEGKPVASAQTGQSVSLCLDRDIDLARGDMLAHPDSAPTVSKSIEAALFWFGRQPSGPRNRYILKHQSRSVAARIDYIRHGIDITKPALTAAPDALGENDLAIARISLQAPIACDPYRRNRHCGAFMLIDEATDETVAAGLIGADTVPLGV